jgi:hypothetical protein
MKTERTRDFAEVRIEAVYLIINEITARLFFRRRQMITHKRSKIFMKKRFKVGRENTFPTKLK